VETSISHQRADKVSDNDNAKLHLPGKDHLPAFSMVYYKVKMTLSRVATSIPVESEPP
jgi:hypothetical protein